MTSAPCRSRRLLLLATGAWAAWPRAVFAQGVRPYRVALVFTTTPVADMIGDRPVHPGARAFVEALGANGFAPGRDLIYEPRSAEGRYERYPSNFAELVERHADAIVTVGDDMTRQARAATSTIPIAMAYSNAPVEAGLVQSLARPGGSVTGLATNPTPQVEAKRLQLLQEAAPAASRVAFLGLRSEWEDRLGQSVRAEAVRLGLALRLAAVDPTAYERALGTLTRELADALFASNSPVNFGNRERLVQRVAAARLPAVYHAEEFVLAGGLLSYGTNVPELFRRAAGIVARLLRGARAATLPVEQPTVFDLAVNLATARELGLKLPPSILLRADRLVQ